MRQKRGDVLISLGIVAVILLMFMVLSLFEGVFHYWESRFLFASGKRALVETPVAAIAFAGYAWCVWWACIRKTDGATWLPSIGAKIGFSVVLLGFVAYLESMLFGIAVGLVGTMPKQPATLSGIVTDAGSSLPYRGTREAIAKLRTPDGGKLVLGDFDVVYTRNARDVMKPNGSCDLARLPTGTPLTITGRKSSLGFVIDSISTPADCRP